MRIMMITKYPPIQGGVSRDCYWLARLFAEIGHEVTVVTNAFEVEKEYRLSLVPEDNIFLEGKFGEGSIRLVNTSIDPKHLYIPQNNPTTTKIVGLALEAIANSKPDFIYSHYLEPYGFSAMIVNALTGIPFAVRHAGSDVGRLMLSNQLKPAYVEVFKRAKAIICSGRVYGALLHEGVQPERILNIPLNYLHPDVFSPSNDNFQPNEALTLCVYGKAGKGKGTFALLRAVKYLKQEGINVRLKARWGGRVMPRVIEFITENDLQDVVELLPFVPNWRIPEFIHSCDISFFLEHGFNITQHAPSIPRELLINGAAFITTSEIANKPIYRSVLKDGENCLVVDDPNDMIALVDKIMQLKNDRLRSTISRNAGLTLSAAKTKVLAVESIHRLIQVMTE